VRSARVGILDQLDLYSTNTRSRFERLPTRSLLDFFDSHK